MRLLDLTTLYLDGGESGVNTYLREKASYIGRRRPEVEHRMILTGSSTRGEIIEGSHVHFLRSPSLPGNPSHRVLVSFRKLRALLRELDPDVVEVDCSYFLPRAVRKAFRDKPKPIVGTIHAHLPRLYTREVRNPLRSFFTRRTEFLSWRYAEFCARPCDRVIATSQDVLESCAAHRFPPLEHVPLGVNVDLFRCRSRDGTAVEGIDPGRPVVLYVGRLSPEKGLDLLFEAHTRVSGETGSQLVIVGEGPLAEECRRFESTNSGVRFLGAVPYGEQLARLYSAADALALPSRYEAFGLVVLEALAAGLSVAAVRSGGPAETLPDELGFLAEPGDRSDFANKLAEAIAVGRGDPQRRRDYVESEFSWDATFDKHFEIYENLLSNDPVAEVTR